jgi:hypothetical protein
MQRAALLNALSDDHAAVIRLLSEAIGSRLSSAAFCDFLTVLDLSRTGAMDRVALARAVRVGVILAVADCGRPVASGEELDPRCGGLSARRCTSRGSSFIPGHRQTQD